MNKLSQHILSSLIAVLTFICVGCTHTDTPIEPVTRLDQILAQYPEYDHIRQLEVADSLKAPIDAMFAVLGENVVTTGMLDRWGRSEVVRVFQPDVDSIYPDSKVIERQIGGILSRAEADSLLLPHFDFVTVTWGNPRPIVRVDSIVLIALNHFLGADYPGYAQWQEYRRSEKTPAQLPYSIASVLCATQYPMTINDATLLSWMLYEGALVEARMRLVPDACLADALGYTEQQLKFADDNCKRIWEEMALRKLIYETDPAVVDRFIAPAPNSPLLQNQTPGRIGRYIGYRIVNAYLKRHPDTSLPQLLSPDFYGNAQSLIDSGFSGR